MSKRLAICVTFASVIGTCVLGQVSDWGTSGDWNVRINAEAGNGCFIEKDFDSVISPT